MGYQGKGRSQENKEGYRGIVAENHKDDRTNIERLRINEKTSSR